MNAHINLHSGGQLVSLDQLANAHLPIATPTYTPVGHFDFVELVKQSLIRTGYAVNDEQHALHNQRYFGIMNLESPYSDRTTTIGLRNSHDHKFPASMVVGNTVFVCSNLAFNGEVKFTRRHTTHIMRDLPYLIDSRISKIHDFEISQEHRVNSYKNQEMSIKDIDHALMSLLRAKVFPGTTLVKILNEWTTPRHEEFREAGSTLWRFYNACTEFMKDNLWLLPQKSFILHNVLDKFTILEGEYENCH